MGLDIPLGSWLRPCLTFEELQGLFLKLLLAAVRWPLAHSNVSGYLLGDGEMLGSDGHLEQTHWGRW